MHSELPIFSSHPLIKFLFSPPSNVWEVEFVIGGVSSEESHQLMNPWQNLKQTQNLKNPSLIGNYKTIKFCIIIENFSVISEGKFFGSLKFKYILNQVKIFLEYVYVKIN